jgi:hypothetical protein
MEAKSAKNADVRALAEVLVALREIAGRGCERYVKPLRCGPELTFDAEYGAEQVCNPCHAYRALIAFVNSGAEKRI